MKPVLPSTASGVIVLCDQEGAIVRVVHDGLGLASRLKSGMPLAEAIGADGHPGDVAEDDLAKLFMETLRDSGYAFGWRIGVPVLGETLALSFTGGATNDGFLIVGEAAQSDAARLVEELMRINNETVNSFRSAAKQAALSTLAQNERDNELLGELSHANNDVMTAQRELAKKNAILAHTNAALEAAGAALELKQAALEAANAQLDALATTDGLTGVKNRRAFNERLTEEVARTGRSNLPLSLLLMDVDKFKQYNDNYGHQAGDYVLKTIGRLLRDGARSHDFVARYGGEEFTVVHPETDAAAAVMVAERLRCSIEREKWVERAVTASFGAATLTPEISTDIALIGAADAALYASKENGRNCVTHANS